MQDQGEESVLLARLQRLWKGTLFVGITGSYVLIISLLFALHTWRAALLGSFFIVLSQFFRYIANDVDRIGWTISKQEQGERVTEPTRGFQARMRYLLVGLVQVQLERRLDRLREMAEQGQISQRAYESTRDKYRIHGVMDDDRILEAAL